MLTHYSFYCPYCKQLLGTPERPNSYGSPLKNCPTCGKTYIDSYCAEPAFFEFRSYSLKQHLGSATLLSWTLAFIVTAIIFVFTAIFGFYDHAETICLTSLGITFPLFWLIIFFTNMRNRKRLDKTKRKKWQESDLRLRNSEYASILKNFGYNVPPRYLPAGFQRDPNAVPYQAAWVAVPPSIQGRPCSQPDGNALSGRI